MSREPMNKERKARVAMETMRMYKPLGAGRSLEESLFSDC